MKTLKSYVELYIEAANSLWLICFCMPGKLKSLARYKFLNSMYACNSHAFTPILLYIFSQHMLDKSDSKACLVWSSAMFKGKKRIEGQVLSQAARLISAVHCQPPRKTWKSVMLTSCNTVTLCRHRNKRWEGGRERGSRDWDRAGGMERNVDKKIQIYIQQNPPTPSSFSLVFSPTDYIKIIPG